MLAALLGCDGGGGGGDGGANVVDPGTVPADLPAPITAGAWYRPPSRTSWQWQLKPSPVDGSVNTSYAVAVYDLDLFDFPAPGIAALQAAGQKIICYFSAGSSEDWRPDFAQFLPADMGAPLAGWAGERWLDVRSANVLRIMKTRLALAASKGCDGVEPDNVDGFANASGFGLIGADQYRYNAAIANEAHRLGLAVGLKNDLAQVPALLPYFDFAVNEQCHEFAECDRLAPFVAAGKAVFNAEYQARYRAPSAVFDALCASAAGAGLSTLVLPLALDGTFRDACP